MTYRVGDGPRVNTGSTTRTDAGTTGNTVQQTPATQQTPNTGWQAGTGARRTTGVQEAQAVESNAPPRPQRLTGHMEMSDDGNTWKMRLATGQQIDLVTHPKGMSLQNSNQPMNPMYARAFINDNIQMTVRGQLGSDGKFQVEDFSPGASDRYVSGRVQLRSAEGQTVARGTPEAANATVFVNTARGDVQIADPTLAENFRLAGPLGVFLPGDP